MGKKAASHSDKLSCYAAVLRAVALGWYVFPQWHVFGAYILAALTVYVYNIYNYMIRRKIKDIPKTSLPKVLVLYAQSSYSFQFTLICKKILLAFRQL